MRKLLIISMLMLFAVAMQGQVIVKQIAFGAKDVDSLVGTAAGATTGSKYYYLNMTGTVASGKIVSTTSFTQYEILAIQVVMVAPTKTADMMDSTQITIEVSYDNTNWTKWVNAGATTTATQTQWKQGGPRVFGAGVYTYTSLDCVTVPNAAGGAIFMPNGMVAPYVRVYTKSFDDATGAYYPLIYFALKKL